MLKAELCYSSERKVPHKKVAVLFGRPSLTFTQRSFYTSLHAHMYTIEDDFRGTIKNDQCFFLCYVNQFNLMFSAHWPLLSMVFQWFLGPSTITMNWLSAPKPLISMVFQWFWGPPTITMNWLSAPKPLVSMVMDHWTNDAMVSMDCSPLTEINLRPVY